MRDIIEMVEDFYEGFYKDPAKDTLSALIKLDRKASSGKVRANSYFESLSGGVVTTYITPILHINFYRFKK